MMLTGATLTADFEMSGLAWFPDALHTQFDFRCQYRHEGVSTVALLGTSRPDIAHEPVTVWGLSRDGYPVTFILWPNPAPLLVPPGPGLWKGTYAVTRIAEGHVTSDTTFTRCFVTYTGLDEWIGRALGDGPGPWGPLPDGTRLTVAPRAIRSQTLLEDRTTRRWEVQMEMPAGSTWDTVRTHTEVIAQYLSLVIGQPVYADSVQVSGLVDDRMDALFSTMPKRLLGSPHPLRMPVPFNPLSRQQNQSVCEWFSLRDTMGATVGLYMAVIYHQNLYLELSFLSMVMALESYHRSLGSGEYMAEPRYRKMIQPLVDAIPVEFDDPHRAAVCSRLRFGYEWSLRSRIKDILGRLPSEVSAAIVDGTPAQFAEAVVSARNDLVHTGRPAASREQVRYVTARLRKLLGFLLLDAVGLPCDGQHAQLLP